MAVPVPITFASGNQALAAYQSGIEDVLDFLMNPPYVEARVTTPIDLTAGVFTSVTFDSVINGDGAILSGVTEDGMWVGYAFLRTTPIRGNKNIRAQVNGVVDEDSDPFDGDANMFGVQTTAKSALAVPFAAAMEAGDFMDIGLFIDDAETTPAQIVNGKIYMRWAHNL